MLEARTQMRADTWRVDVDGQQTSAVYTPSPKPDGTAFICAHGAGGHMDDVPMRNVSERLLAQGAGVVRFNFLYRAKGSQRPDLMPLLKACFDAVITYARRVMQPDVLIIGGRSMGGRVASMLAAESYPCDALLLLAYPLHPAGQPQKLRDAHLAHIKVPVLCLNGTRDALCRPDLMEPIVRRLAGNWTMHWLQHADHGFHVLKSSGRTDADVLDEVTDAYSRWRPRLRGQP